MSDVKRSDLIVRYSRGERANHWIVAGAFFLAGLSGLALFHPLMYWLSGLFGGGQWTRILHPWFGLFMFLLFFVLAVRMFKHNSIQKRDIEWLKRVGDVVSHREDRVPEVGKYNGGQKLLYFVLVICMLVLIVTGILMWRPWFAYTLVPIPVVRVAAVFHAFFAFVLICAIIVHIYSAYWVKGSMQAMTRGTVTPGWAYKHHRLWWRQLRKPAADK